MFRLGTHSIDQVLQFFGRPASVTAFLRSLRGIQSEIDDTFTIVLQYGGKRNLLVTIKTTVVSCPLGPMGSQLKVLIRGTKGSYIKFGTDAQEADSMAGKSATEPGFGVEDESLHGVLCTIEEFDSACQKQDPVSKKYIDQYPTIKGDWLGYYSDLVKALKGEQELFVRPEQSRDSIRVIELARESHNKSTTMNWS